MSGRSRGARSLATVVRGAQLAAVYGVAVPALRTVEAVGLGGRVLRTANGALRRRMTDQLEGFGDDRPAADDVVVATYPKSGTNWMLQVAHQVATQGAGTFEHVHDVVPWPDGPPFSPDVALPEAPGLGPAGVRVVKTHLPVAGSAGSGGSNHAPSVPYRPQARYLVVVRDPKDVAVSSYHFARDLMLGPLTPSVATWVDLLCSDVGVPLGPVGPWPAHTDGWWRLRERPNILVVTFAEMKADLAGVVRRVAALMDVELDPAQHAAVVEHSSFTWMRAIDERFYPRGGPDLPWRSGAGRMMRRWGHGRGGRAPRRRSAPADRRLLPVRARPPRQRPALRRPVRDELRRRSEADVRDMTSSVDRSGRRSRGVGEVARRHALQLGPSDIRGFPGGTVEPW